MKLPYDKYHSSAYWTTLIQMALYGHIKRYLEETDMSRKEFAEKLGVSKGCVSQIMNGDFDHKLSKLVELALACDLVPEIKFKPMSDAQKVEKTYLPTTIILSQININPDLTWESEPQEVEITIKRKRNE